MLHTSRALAFVSLRAPFARSGAAVVAKQISGQRQQLQLLSRCFATGPSSNPPNIGASGEDSFAGRANTSGGGRGRGSGRGGRASRGAQAGGGYLPPKPNSRPPVVTRGTLSNNGAPPPTSAQARLLSARAATAITPAPAPSTSARSPTNSRELHSKVTASIYVDTHDLFV